MQTNELWVNPSQCSGCGSCMVRCPKDAISLAEGAGGFVFPKIDGSLCVDCGLCRKVCGLQNHFAQKTKGPWYAAAYKNDCSESASGGAFYAIARSVVLAGGVVFGAACLFDETGINVRHVMADDLSGLRILRGSKYVQSDAYGCFPQVVDMLKKGREVLFSGTPCQVAGLRGYLGKEWPNLFTIDLVCHGVSSEAMLRDYLALIARRANDTVNGLNFRSKRDGWTRSRLLELRYESGARQFLDSEKTSYYDLFNHSKTLRDSCYACPFAGPLRPGDITVGDFWGVDKNRPDVLEHNGFNLEKGISCLLVNDAKGVEALRRYGDSLALSEVSFEDIAKGNGRLRCPNERDADHVLYLNAFDEGGWNSVERLWKRRERGIVYQVKRAIWIIAHRWLPGLLNI